MAGGRAGVFLDRDGVLMADVENLTRPEQIELIPGAAAAVRDLKQAGFPVVVITNQPVVARGWLSERDVSAIHERLQELLRPGGGEVTAFYVCPHHPNATLPEYRQECLCRKPAPGMLLQAAGDLALDLPRSYLVGDRITDILAGRAAGCTTVLVESGRHADAPIETARPIDLSVREDYRCRNLPAAARWILARQPR